MRFYASMRFGDEKTYVEERRFVHMAVTSLFGQTEQKRKKNLWGSLSAAGSTNQKSRVLYGNRKVHDFEKREPGSPVLEMKARRQRYFRVRFSCSLK